MIGKKGIRLIFIICLSIVTSIYFYLENREVFNQYSSSKKPVPDYVSETINKSRLVNKLDKEDAIAEFSKMIYNFQDFSDELADEDILIANGNEYMDLLSRMKEVTSTEAIEDVNHLLKLMKYGYAGYELFGGDKVFLEAKENMLKEIKEYSGDISSEKFNEIILKNLDFIQDGHFIIGKYKTAKAYVYYSSEKYEFLIDSKGYYTKIDGKKYYISLKEDSISENNLKLSINQDGEIVYYIGCLLDSTDEYQYIDVELRRNNNVIRENMEFHRYRRADNFDDSSIYEYNTIEEIPLIEIRSMHANTQDQLIQLNQFREDAAVLKNKNLFVIDVRGNGGGSDSYCEDWTRTYTGNRFRVRGGISSKLWTRTTMKGLETSKNSEDESIRNWAYSIENEIKASPNYPGWTDINYREQEAIENSNLIFVIMDKGVASSGEAFIEILRSMENVIFVGVNTHGASLVGDNILYMLPNSKMPVHFGRNLNLNVNLENLDGEGFFPDFWVHPNDSLDRVLKFIKKYDVHHLNEI